MPLEILRGMRPRKSETPPKRNMVTSFAVSVSADAMAAEDLLGLHCHCCLRQKSRIDAGRKVTGQ